MANFSFSSRYNNLVEKTKDLSKYSTEELISLKNEANEIYDEYNNFQLVVKRNCNSLYGVSANEFFSLHDTDVAEDITTTGKHYAVIVDIAINKFFLHWAKPEILVKIQEFYPDVIKLHNFEDYEADTINDICCYGDTDSRYIRLDYIYNLMETKDGKKQFPENNRELSDFMVFLENNFISDIIRKTIDEDCLARNARLGYLKMNHEVTAQKGIFLKKKKYILSPVWVDGKHLNKIKLKVTGVELKQGKMSEKAKKILAKMVDKYLIDGYSIEDMRNECLKIFKYIKAKKDKELIYLISSVSGFEGVEKNDKNVYYSADEKNHIQRQIYLSWLNFVEENNLQQQFKKPFEGQKMQYYYCNENSGYKVIGVPDDIALSDVPNLPEPNWNKMIISTIMKPFCNYILDKPTIDDEDVEMFLLGAKIWKFN